MVKPGYKQTEVGVIPEDWRELRIDAVCKLVNGRGFKPHEWKSSGLPIIRIQNLNGSEEFNFFQGAYAKKLEIQPGQLLFAWSGSRGTSFGPHIWNGPLGLLNYHTWKVEIKETEIFQPFFLHALKKLTAFIESKAHGASALVHTQKWEMEGFKFPSPTQIAEQQAIATALSDTDELIESLEQLLTKKRQIKQGAMQELLTGKKRLPGFSGEWEIKALNELASISKGTQLPSSKANPNGHFPHFNGGISPSSYTDNSNTEANTIAISEGGNSCGYVQLVPHPFWCGGHCYAVAPKAVNNRFLFHALKGQQTAIQGLRVGSGLPNVQKTALSNFTLQIPSDSAEQTAIAEALSDMDAEIEALETKLTKARQLKQGMMQELLTGRIRLV